MSGTIVIETNLDGLYYNLSTKDAGGKTEYVEFHTRLPKGETEVTVDGDGYYQVTIIDISNYYGGGQYSEGFYLADGETICVSKCFYDADGNDLEPSRPRPSPNRRSRQRPPRSRKNPHCIPARAVTFWISSPILSRQSSGYSSALEFTHLFLHRTVDDTVCARTPHI